MRLIVKNVGMVEEADVQMDGLTVIAGYNDTGKSTIGKIGYCLTKAFENFEADYEETKNKEIRRLLRNFLVHFTRHIDMGDSKVLGKSGGDDFRYLMGEMRFFRKIDQEGLLERIDKLKSLLEKKSLGVEEKNKKIIHKKFDEIEKLVKGTKSKSSKIRDFLETLFDSEFEHNRNKVFRDDSNIKAVHGSNEIINIAFKKEKVSIRTSEISLFPFTHSLFIETPFVVTYKSLEPFLTSRPVGAAGRPDEVYHVKDLSVKLRSAGINSKSGLDVKKIIGGEVYYDESEYAFFFRKNGKKFTMLNTASGIKSFGMLQMLDRSGEFDENLLLVIDEPEVHLHPNYQIEYARLLVKLVKERKIKALINSHSPYMIEALNKFSKEGKITKDTRFYLSEVSGETGLSVIKDKTEFKDEIFHKLSEPFGKLVFGD